MLLSGEMLFSSAPFGDPLVSILYPWRVFLADTAAFKGPRLALCIAFGTTERQGHCQVGHSKPWQCPCFSVALKVIHEVSGGPLRSAVSAPKAPQRSEIEMRELVGETKEKSVSPMEGFCPPGKLMMFYHLAPTILWLRLSLIKQGSRNCCT